MPEQKEMTEDNGEMLVDLVAQELLRQLEAVIFQKTFTQFGGIQFSKEVQYLADFCSEHTRIPIHGRFARIRQIAQVLSLDRVCIIILNPLIHIIMLMLVYVFVLFVW